MSYFITTKNKIFNLLPKFNEYKNINFSIHTQKLRIYYL